jgi:hypothetical protein
MRLPTILATIALTANTALAAYSVVHNKCDFPVWVTSVGKQVGQTTKLSPGEWKTEAQIPQEDNVGRAIKITKSEKDLWESKPVLTFAYSYKKDTHIYYDLSSAYGFDFQGKKIRIHNTQGKPVEEIVWVGEPKENHTAAYMGEADLTLELCDDFVQRA